MAVAYSEDHAHGSTMELFIRVLMVVIPCLIAFVVYGQMKNAKETTVFEIQEIQLLEDIPAPEPEPEPEPIVEEQIEEIEIETQEIEEPAADDMPNSDDPLGLDSDGVAGSDAFGLAANKGGRALMLGTEEGVGSMMLAQYAGKLEKSISKILEQHKEIRYRDYIIRIAIWIDTEGQIQRLEFKGSTGDISIDEALEQILDSASIRIEPPPPGLQQPVNLRIRSLEIG